MRNFELHSSDIPSVSVILPPSVLTPKPYFSYFSRVPTEKLQNKFEIEDIVSKCTIKTIKYQPSRYLLVPTYKGFKSLDLVIDSISEECTRSQELDTESLQSDSLIVTGTTFINKT